MLFNFLTPRISLYVILGLLACIAGEEVRIHLWRADYEAQGTILTQAQADLALAHANAATLTAAIHEQNAAITALQTKAEADKQAADARVRAALSVRRARPAVKGSGVDVMNAWTRREYQ
jgi:hypothetical protein